MPQPTGLGGIDSTGGRSLSKDQLTSIANSLATTDPTQASNINNLVNNFSKADTNGDGNLSTQEAMVFQKANSSSSNNASTSAYQGGHNIGADIQSLIQQLSSSSTSGSANSTQSDLQSSFQNLINALGGSGSSNSSNSTTLEKFLSALANNLQGSTHTGNLVDKKV